MAALPSLIKARLEDEAYRMYSAECMRVITENTAKRVGGTMMTAKYADMISQKPKDTRSGEEIAADVIKKCGLKVVSE